MWKITVFSKAYQSDVKPLKGHETLLETLGYEFNQSSAAYEWTLYTKLIQNDLTEEKSSSNDVLVSIKREFSEGLLKEAVEALQYVQNSISLTKKTQSIEAWLQEKAKKFDVDSGHSNDSLLSDSCNKVPSKSGFEKNNTEIEARKNNKIKGKNVNKEDDINAVETESKINVDKELGKKEQMDFGLQKPQEKNTIEPLTSSEADVTKGSFTITETVNNTASNMIKETVNNEENGHTIENDLTLAEITAMQEQGIQPPNILNIDNNRVSVDFEKYFKANTTALNNDEDSQSAPNRSLSQTINDEVAKNNRIKPWQV